MEIFKTIEVKKYKSVVTIWLNRPELHNAINDVMIGELTRSFQSFYVETDVRAIILRGKGKSFCAGADLNYMKGIAGYGIEENVEDGRRLAELFRSIYECPIPTIAVVPSVPTE